MAFNFPNSPTDGMPYTPFVGGPTYSWNAAGGAWVLVTPPPGGSPYVSKAGDTMTGALTINNSLNVSGPAQTGDLNVSGNLTVAGTGMAWMAPGGRLTFVQTDPRPSNAESATKIYYVPYLHRYVSVPASASTAITMQIPATGVMNDYTDATTNPAAISTSVASHFGLFLWNNNGVLTLTRGPAVQCNTGGAVASAVNLAFGPNNLVVNNLAITNGPAAKMGLYVGTAFTYTNGTSYMRTGGTTGGQYFGLANYYNRLTATTQLPYAANSGPSNRTTMSVMYAAIANAGNNDLQRFTASWGFSGAPAAGGYSGVFLRAGWNGNANTPFIDWYTIGTPSQTTTITDTVAGAPILQPGCWTFYLGATDAGSFTPGGWGRSTTEFSLEI